MSDSHKWHRPDGNQVWESLSAANVIESTLIEYKQNGYPFLTIVIEIWNFY